MEGIEELLNRLTDQDWGWWPFVSLRPKPDEKMTTDYVGRIALVYGSIGGFVLSMVYLLFGSRYAGPPSFSLAVWVVLAITVPVIAAFLVIYRLTFAVAWNRRADRLLTDPAYGGVEAHEPFDPAAYGTYGVWVPKGPLRRTNDA